MASPFEKDVMAPCGRHIVDVVGSTSCNHSSRGFSWHDTITEERERGREEARARERERERQRERGESDDLRGAVCWRLRLAEVACGRDSMEKCVLSASCNKKADSP